MTLKSDGYQSTSSLSFARQFIRNPLKTGAITASSPALVRALVSQIDFTSAKSIVELGPGSGVITEGIVQCVTGDTHFFALELNPDFAQLTRERCPGTLVEVGCATTLANRLKTFGISECDCVVSALPWNLFDGETQDLLISAIRGSLASKAQFIFYTYRGTEMTPPGLRLHRVLKKYFNSVNRVDTTWRNIPPASVYVCRP